METQINRRVNVLNIGNSPRTFTVVPRTTCFIQNQSVCHIKFIHSSTKEEIILTPNMSVTLLPGNYFVRIHQGASLSMNIKCHYEVTYDRD